MIGLHKIREEASKNKNTERCNESNACDKNSTNQSGASGRGRGVSIFGVNGGASNTKSSIGRRLRSGEIRIQKDISELDGGDCAKPVFPNPNDL